MVWINLIVANHIYTVLPFFMAKTVFCPIFNRPIDKVMNLLEIKNLKKYFATQKAVDDISFGLEKGSIFGLLGPNGAGKTTLIRMITGIFYPDEGEIILNGKTFNPVEDTGEIGYMPEERGLYKKMKIGEQAVYLAQLKGLGKSEARLDSGTHRRFDHARLPRI